MEIDLLFTAVNDDDWKRITETGSFEPDSFTENGQVKCFEGADAEKIVNLHFSESTTVLLLVIDPLRIQSPIKRFKEDDLSFIAIQGTFSIDAIIDKIKLKKNKNGSFSVKVKHFD
ncbi:MAG: DUF952 domain-containing protein [Balneolaceae bacterium]